MPAGFDVSEYAAQRYSSGKSLNDLHGELSTRLSGLRKELQELIAQRYEDFLGLSTSLSGIDTTVQQTRVSLNEMRKEIDSVHGDFSARLQAIDHQLEQRMQVREAKAHLRLFLDIAQLLDRAELVFREGEGKGSQSAGARIEVLERICADYAQIRYFVGKAGEPSGYAFLASAIERLHKLEARLTAALRETLEQCAHSLVGDIEWHNIDTSSSSATAAALALSPAAHSAAVAARQLTVQCLRAYTTADKHKEAEALLGELLVQPVVERIFAPEPNKQRRGMGLGPEQFSGMLQRALLFAVRVGLPLARTLEAQTPLGTASALDVGVRVFWRTICAVLLRTLPLVFVPGSPDRFRGNYLVALQFTKAYARAFDLQSGAHEYGDDESGGGGGGGEGELAEFISRKWLLPAYFSVRRKQIIDGVKDGVDGLVVSEMGSMAAARACWALARCADPQIVLVPLLPRFWQLALQVLRWTQEAVAGELSELEKGKEASERGLLALSLDVGMLGHQAQTQLLPAFQHLPLPLDSLASLDSPAGSDSLARALAQALAPLHDASLDAQARVCADIVSASCASLASHLRRTTSQYRHTGRKAPTQPSSYVRQLFAGLDAAVSVVSDLGDGLQAAGSGSVVEAIQFGLRQRVCRGVALGVAQAARDALATVSKTEASLQRLRGSKRRMSAPDDLPVPPGVDLRGKAIESDNDKIRRQIWLDTTQVARIVGDEMHVAAPEEFQAFVASIAPLGI
ncbi:Conserved oligomeric Golgi complex subunit 2 [Coemansia sp. Benny D115]|nr:Conserved oligomeric Golgi complex subunit 2 [Coemansia sp. Benny D115]